MPDLFPDKPGHDPGGSKRFNEARSPHRVQLNPPRARSSAVERRYHTPDVVGSIPTAPTTAFRTRSSTWQSTGFVNRRLKVRLLPGAPA